MSRVPPIRRSLASQCNTIPFAGRRPQETKESHSPVAGLTNQNNPFRRPPALGKKPTGLGQKDEEPVPIPSSPFILFLFRRPPVAGLCLYSPVAGLCPCSLVAGLCPRRSPACDLVRRSPACALVRRSPACALVLLIAVSLLVLHSSVAFVRVFVAVHLRVINVVRRS